ncbi:MAG: CAP domain-containing protein [Planctomycetota bacterium]
MLNWTLIGVLISIPALSPAVRADDDLAAEQREALSRVREGLSTFLGDEAPAKDWSDDRIAAQSGGVPTWIRGLETPVRDRLRQHYAEARALVASSEDEALRRRRLEAHQALEGPRRELISLIQSYEKPQQPDVDAKRNALEPLYEKYRLIARLDEKRLLQLSEEEAIRRSQVITAGEETLAAMRAYLDRFDPPGFGIWPERLLPGGLDAKERILPGREETDLEEVIWTLLQLRAGRLSHVVSRIGEILRSSDELSEWERVVLMDGLFRSLDRYNAERVAEDMTQQEWVCTEVTNAYRGLLGLRPLLIEPRLIRASRRHSQEMTDLGYFGHQSPVKDNEWPADRVEQEGYDGGAAENCFAGSSSGQGAFDAWYNSPGHHRNMIGGHLQIGVGHDRGGSMWTELFGASDTTWRALHADLEGAETDLAQTLVKAAGAKAPMPKIPVAHLLHPLARFAASGATSRDPRWTGQAGQLADGLVRSALVTPGADPFAKFGVELLLRNLEHGDPRVRGESVAALRRLTSKAFAYEAEGDAKVRAETVGHWNDWWMRERGKLRLEQVAKSADGTDLELGVALLKDVRAPRVEVETPKALVPLMGEKDRLRIARKNGGGDDTEKAIERALDWLIAHQHPDGAWRGKHFVDLGTGASGAGEKDHEIGITGMVLLCFLSRHHLPDDEKYGQAISKGLEYLKSHLQDFGKFRTGASHYMYSHALGTQALCKAYGLTGDPDLKIVAQRAVDFIVYAQHPTGGGWRYEAREWPDTSATGWQLLALHDAWKAKLRVAGFQGGRRWIDMVSQKGYFRTGYQSKVDPHTAYPRLTSVGMLSKLVCGSHISDGPLRTGAFWLLKHKPEPERPDYYYWYYGSYALFQMGDEFWPEWNRTMKRALLSLQRRDRGPDIGSFDPNTEWGRHGGRIYSTALAILTLEVYYRYERFPEVREFPLTGSWAETFQNEYVSRLGKSAKSNVDREVAKREVEEHFGSGALPFVLRALESADHVELERDLSEILRYIGTPSAIDRIATFLSKGDGAVKGNVFECLGRIGGERVVTLMRAQLQSGSHQHRAFAARELARCREVAALEAIRERVGKSHDQWEKNHHQDAINRLSHLVSVEAAIADLNNLGDREREDLRAGLDVFTDRPVLLEAFLKLKTEHKRHYESCAKMLVTYGRSCAIPLCIELLLHTDEAIRTHAVDYARRLSGANLPFDPKGEPKDRLEQIVEWRRWWYQNRRDFNPDTK